MKAEIKHTGEDQLNESELFFNELMRESRADKKRSLNNIKAALDYLFSTNNPADVTLNSIVSYIQSMPVDDKNKTPKTSQQIKNDKLGMKKYVELRKQDAVKGSNIFKKEEFVRENVDRFMQEDKQTLAYKLKETLLLNKRYTNKICQLEKISNQNKIVIEDLSVIGNNNLIRDIQAVRSVNHSNTTKILRSDEELVLSFFQALTDDFPNIRFTSDGIFFNSVKVLEFSVIEAISKSISLLPEKFLNKLE